MPMKAVIRRRPSSRRGVAMLLVLISMMMATVMTMGYLSSRDNSAIIADNVASAASARWAAESGLAIGVAFMQTNTDMTAVPGGQLLNGYPIGGGSLDLQARDFFTDLPPDANSEFLRLISTAQVASVSQKAEAIVKAHHLDGVAADVDLSEFAIFANGPIELRDSALVTRWPTAPMSALGRPLAISSRSAASDSLKLSNNAVIIDGIYFATPGTSGLLNLLGGLVNAAGQLLGLGREDLQDPIPLPEAPATGVPNPNLLSPSPDLKTSVPVTLAANTRRKIIEMNTSAGVLTLKGNITVIADDDLVLKPGSSVIVDGNVKLVVFDKLVMDTSAIEVKSGKLDLFVRGDVDLTNGYIGRKRLNALRDNTGQLTYANPERLNMYSIDSLLGTPTWKLDQNSVVMANAYVPNARFEVHKSSALYGRVACQTMLMTDQAALFYDPALDQGLGFSRMRGPMFNSSARLLAPFKNLASLNSDVLSQLASDTSTLIKTARDVTFGTPQPPAADTSGPTDPTPRPVTVDFVVRSVGASALDWEREH